MSERLAHRTGGADKILPDLMRAPDLAIESGCSLGHPMELLATTTSTNDLAKRAARDGAPHGATWVAEQQTEGRGRRGHAWVCPRGEGLLFSVLVRLPFTPSRLPPIALAAGLAVRDVVARAAPSAAVMVKWPNDVLIDDRKVAGVLVEAILVGARVEALILGVGVNVNTRDFPDPIAALATSIALASSEPPDRAAILTDLLCAIDRDLHVVVGRGLGLLRARIDAADVLRGRRVRGEGMGESAFEQEGVACGIDDDGRLLVRRSSGGAGGDNDLARWSAGEVHIVR
ncbi:MAG: biotin--[acetyl-CoA-carboxylase] ligase [Polyangiaceae bacterium]